MLCSELVDFRRSGTVQSGFMHMGRAWLGPAQAPALPIRIHSVLPLAYVHKLSWVVGIVVRFCFPLIQLGFKRIICIRPQLELNPQSWNLECCVKTQLQQVYLRRRLSCDAAKMLWPPGAFSPGGRPLSIVCPLRWQFWVEWDADDRGWRRYDANIDGNAAGCDDAGLRPRTESRSQAWICECDLVFWILPYPLIKACKQKTQQFERSWCMDMVHGMIANGVNNCSKYLAFGSKQIIA